MWRKLLTWTSCHSKALDTTKLRTHVKYKMLHKMWRQNFKCSHASLDHHTPEIFTRCYWQQTDRVSIPWMLYRILLAAYTLVTWYLSFINFNRVVVVDKYFIYLTNWSYILLTLQTIAAALIVCHRYVIERRKGQPGGVAPEALSTLPVPYKVYWVMHSICLPSSVVVTAIFWAVVYDPALQPVDVINVTTHVLNSVVSLFDFLLVAHPYRLLHFYWTLIYGLAYVLFTVIYYLAGGTDIYDRPYIYKILDWRSPDMALATCVGVLVVMCGIHLMYWGLQRLKKAIRRRCWAANAGKYAEGEENMGMDHKPASISTIVV